MKLNQDALLPGMVLVHRCDGRREKPGGDVEAVSVSAFSEAEESGSTE